MVPDSRDIAFPTSEALRKYLTSDEFQTEVAQKLKDQYVVDVVINEPKVEQQGDEEITFERLKLNFTRNNAPGLKDAIDFLLLPLMNHGLDQNTVRGSIPRPKSDSFEDSMPYFESKLLHRAEPAMSTESPTRTDFGENGNRSIFDKLRKPGSMSSFSSFIERRRKTGTNSPASLFMHASNNASKASLASMESRDSGYRNPWNDSGIDLDQEGNATAGATWGSFGGSASRPNTSSNSLTGAFETKFPFGVNGNASTTSLNTPMIPGLGMVNGTGHSTAGDGTITPRTRNSADGVSIKEEGPNDSPALPPTSAPAIDEKDEKSNVDTAPINLENDTTAADAATASDTAHTSDTTTATASGSTSGYPGPIGPPH